MLSLVICLDLKAQIIYDKNGNHITSKPKTNDSIKGNKNVSILTNKTFKDSKKNTYPIYKTQTGRLYIIRTNKNRKYRQYLKQANP